MYGKTKKIKHVKLGDGLDKVFSEKVKRSSTAHKAKGSTWLKKPPKYAKKTGRLAAS